MPVLTSAVGARYQPRAVDVTRRRLLSFAAGVGADWPELLDDARTDGVSGFPTYCASLEFNALQGGFVDQADPLGASRQERLRGVHAGQDSVFHAPIRPGDRVVTEAAIAGIRDIPAGALITLRAETRNRDTGDVLTTSWVTQVLRGVAISGAPRATAGPPSTANPSPRGEPARRARFPVTRVFPHVYAECADIWNPIHSERTVALAAGLPDIILQGSATWTLAAREAIDAFCGRDPRRLGRLAARFSTMVLPGDVLTIELFEPEDGVAPIRVVNQAGEPVLKGAFAQILPYSGQGAGRSCANALAL